MKSRNTTTRRITVLIAMIVLAAGWALWGAGRAAAVADSELPTPGFGLALGQTARLSVLNSGQESGIIIDYKFLDSDGRTLAQSVERVLVEPRQMKSFDLDGDSLAHVRDRFGRIQMRAVVIALGGPDTKNLHVSVEVIDNATGKTSFTTQFFQNNL